MWTIVKKQPIGILIDWDFASGPVSHPPEDPQQTAFTLNVAFLAIDLLKMECVPRLYRHDLESFFWVFWSIIISKADVNGLDEYVTISDWESDSVPRRWVAKTAFLDRGRHQVIKRLEISQQSGLSHPGVITCLSRLSNLVSKGQDALEGRAQTTNVETADGNITYTEFVAAVKFSIQ